jgi:hypothetical protein
MNAQYSLVTSPPMPLQDMQTLAVAIAKSGLFGIRTPEQALVLMAIAQAEGRHPVEAARDYDIINNRPAKKAEAMLRDFIKAGGTVKWHSLTDELADATFTHPQTGEVRIDWDTKRAMTAFGKKDMYTKFPRQMLRSRVVSEGVRTLWPLATSGMYEPGEVADIPHNGPTIEAEPDAREALNAETPLRAAAAPMPKAPRVVEKAAEYEAPPKPAPAETGGKPQRGYRDILSSLRIALRDAKSAEEVDHILCAEEILRAKETFKDDALIELTDIIQSALKRWWHEEPDELPEVNIAGEEKAGA